MPELTENMYCHQQICIPPTYPYLLRQFAKAAIRSQPTDLLRWSCAYFRALALGLQPPVKVRLEYPIISTHYGLTPGWLKTLIQQFSGYNMVTWPQLYDRWRGICLQVLGLQEIIMMAGFNNPAEIPWLRFVATAAGHLTANLTNTMILICELLTDEPEGGSAMIPFGIFADLYPFLARIDGCEERMVYNFYFTESNLDLTKQEEMPVAEEEKDELDRSLVTSMEEEQSELTSHRSDLEKYLKGITDDMGEEDLISKSEEPIKVAKEEKLDTHSSCYIILDPEDGKECKDDHEKSVSSSESSESSEKEVIKEPSKITEESAESLEIFQYEQESESKESDESSTLTMPSDMSKDVASANFRLPPVPGIGAQVPEKMIEDVLKYMKEQANRQQGMIMPRNIKHFLCPALELCPALQNL